MVKQSDEPDCKKKKKRGAHAPRKKDAHAPEKKRDAHDPPSPPPKKIVRKPQKKGARKPEKKGTRKPEKKGARKPEKKGTSSLFSLRKIKAPLPLPPPTQKKKGCTPPAKGAREGAPPKKRSVRPLLQKWSVRPPT